LGESRAYRQLPSCLGVGPGRTGAAVQRGSVPLSDYYVERILHDPLIKSVTNKRVITRIDDLSNKSRRTV